MGTGNLSIQEKEKLKEIELKHQGEWLTGGYPRLTLLFYEKMIRANEYNNKLLEQCERMEEENKALKNGDYEEAERYEELLEKAAEEIKELREEARGLRKTVQELAARNRAYAERHFTAAVPAPVLGVPVPDITPKEIRISTQRKIDCISITFGEEGR